MSRVLIQFIGPEYAAAIPRGCLGGWLVPGYAFARRVGAMRNA